MRHAAALYHCGGPPCYTTAQHQASALLLGAIPHFSQAGYNKLTSTPTSMSCGGFCTQATILANLKDPDVSIRRRALDLLFTMCDGGAAVEVVEELVRPGHLGRLLLAAGTQRTQHTLPGGSWLPAGPRSTSVYPRVLFPQHDWFPHLTSQPCVLSCR